MTRAAEGTPKVTRLVRLYTVPAGTSPRRCKGPSCGKLIYWVQSPTNKSRKIPVDCDVPNGCRPSGIVDPRQLDAFDEDPGQHDGVGQSHFETCPDVERFSR